MADTILLQLVSPERLLVEEQVSEVQIPALDGFIGVLPGAAPLLSELKPGGEEIDLAEAQKKLNEANRALAKAGGGDPTDPMLALEESMRAQAAFDAAQAAKK